MTRKQILSGIAVTGILGGGILVATQLQNDVPKKVPCLVLAKDTSWNKFTVYDSVPDHYFVGNDSANVPYISGYDTVRKKQSWIQKILNRPGSIKSITPILSDSLHIIPVFGDSLKVIPKLDSTIVIKDTMINGFCDDTIKTKFGVIVGDNDLKTAQKVQVADLYGVNYVRTQLFLKDFDGTADNIDKYFADGKKIILNINWQPKGNTPSKFCTDYVLYKKQLDWFLSIYKGKIFRIVIENEALTGTYFNDDMRNYLALLKIAVQECALYGIDATNSGDHLEYVQAILSAPVKNGVKILSGKVASCDTLLKGYKSIGMKFINTHSGKIFDDPALAGIDGVTDYIRSETGVNEVISNETVFRQGTKDYVDRVVKFYRNANYTYCIIYDAGKSTDGLDALGLHIAGTTDIAPLGAIFKNSVSSQSN